MAVEKPFLHTDPKMTPPCELICSWFVIVEVEGLVEAGLNITSDDGLKLEPEGLNGVGDGTGREMGNQGTPDMGIRLGRPGSISAQQCAAQHPLELVRRPSIRARTEEIQTENAKSRALGLAPRLQDSPLPPKISK